MVKLTKWTAKLASEPETGMGYQIATVRLNDGRKFDQVVIVEGRITQIRGRDDVPFTDEEITDITITHDKWDFNAENRRPGRPGFE